ncbi:YrzA family protein [Bacillus taeanensis]|uniref:DUF2536 domain-containing protein n=1 Tax=Bacillus taeanensis TaxID=273032 RepID=A0A366XY18_9BACI|nr:YrzA family protein [Bacillus taeanensis]RBW70458.1 DUF2536 domain-containing protein [Bacillus taeanensis]
MGFSLERIEDKVELFEARDLSTLERKINEQIDINKALLLQVYHVSHNVYTDPNDGKPLYTAVIHFKAKN